MKASQVELLSIDSDMDPKVKSSSTSKHATNKRKRAAKIMLIEDELLIAESLKETLVESGYDVVGVFTKAEEAIFQFRRLDPDLVLLDVRLKGSMDGIHAANIIQHTLKDVPVIFVTAHPASAFPHLALLVKDSYIYLTKPSTAEDLVDAIRKLLGKRD